LQKVRACVLSYLITQKWSGPLGRGELGCEPLNKVGATSQPLGFPAPLARLHPSWFDERLASGTGRAHRLSIRSTSEILHWFKQLSHPHLLRSTAPYPLYPPRQSCVQLLQRPAATRFISAKANRQEQNHRKQQDEE